MADDLRVTINGIDLSVTGPEVKVDAEAFETVEYRSAAERVRMERRPRMRWLDWWAGRCYRAGRRFTRIADLCESLGDRAYGEWERKAYRK